MGREDVTVNQVERLRHHAGAFMTDINLGIYLRGSIQGDRFDRKSSIRYHNYEEVSFRDFVRGLVNTKWHQRSWTRRPRPSRPGPAKARAGKAPITVERLFQRLNGFLEDDTVVVADVGDSLFAATDLFIHHRTEFLAAAYYASMGFAIPLESERSSPIRNGGRSFWSAMVRSR
jgi:indolepyruvate decarboxylase